MKAIAALPYTKLRAVPPSMVSGMGWASNIGGMKAQKYKQTGSKVAINGIS